MYPLVNERIKYRSFYESKAENKIYIIKQEGNIFSALLSVLAEIKENIELYRQTREETKKLYPALFRD